MFAFWIYLYPNSSYKEACFIRKNIILSYQAGIATQTYLGKRNRYKKRAQEWLSTSDLGQQTVMWRTGGIFSKTKQQFKYQEVPLSSLYWGSTCIIVHIACKTVIALLAKSLHLLWTKLTVIQFWPTWGLPDHVPSLTSTCRSDLSKGEF